MFYASLENIIIGATAANAVLVAITQVMRLDVAPLQAGNWAYLIPVFWGLSLYTFFSRTYFNVYRYSIIAMLAIDLALAIRSNMSTMWLTMSGWAVKFVGNPLVFAFTIGELIFTFLYFLYSVNVDRRLGTILKPVRRWMPVAFGFYLGAHASGAYTIPRIASGITLTIQIMLGVGAGGWGKLVLAIAGIVIIADIYLRRRRPQTVLGSTITQPST
jgi:hypothetical protein